MFSNCNVSNGIEVTGNV